MGFVEAIRSGFQKYATVTGRATRSEFWFWMLFAFLAGVVCRVLDAVFFPVEGGLQPFALLSTFGLLLPNICVTTRRLHDVNKSGWWQLLALTIIGLIPLFYWYCKRSDAEVNRFGA